MLFDQPDEFRTTDNAWCAKHSFWSAAWGWNAQVLSGKMLSWQGGCMVLPPGSETLISFICLDHKYLYLCPNQPHLPLLTPPSFQAGRITFVQNYCFHLFSSSMVTKLNLNRSVMDSVQQSVVIYLVLKSVLILSFMSHKSVLSPSSTARQENYFLSGTAHKKTWGHALHLMHLWSCNGQGPPWQ